MHFFDQHESACKAQWVICNENQQTHPHPTPITAAMENAGVIQGGIMDSDKIIEGCNAMQIEDTVVETDSLDMPWAGDAKEPISSK